MITEQKIACKRRKHKGLATLSLLLVLRGPGFAWYILGGGAWYVMQCACGLNDHKQLAKLLPMTSTAYDCTLRLSLDLGNAPNTLAKVITLPKIKKQLHIWTQVYEAHYGRYYYFISFL